MGIQCPSTQDVRKPSMRSPQYSDLADEQEMLLFGGGLNASDSGFGGSSNVLLPDDAGILQVIFAVPNYRADATACRIKWERNCC